MSQGTTELVSNPIVPPGDTGPTMVGKFNALRAAILSTFSGATAPTGAAAGTLWLDTSGTPWVLKMFDGSSSVPLADINSATHLVTKVYAPLVTTSVDGLMAAADKTKLNGIASGATANSSDAALINRANHTGSQATGTITGLDAALSAKAELAVEDQAMTGGFRITTKALNGGNPVTTGTITPDPGDRFLQSYTNGGAHTLAAPANDGVYNLLVTNNSGAGTITFTGFTLIFGDTLNNTNGSKFLLQVERIGGVSILGKKIIS